MCVCARADAANLLYALLTQHVPAGLDGHKWRLAVGRAVRDGAFESRCLRVACSFRVAFGWVEVRALCEFDFEEVLHFADVRKVGMQHFGEELLHNLFLVEDVAQLASHYRLVQWQP